MAFEVEPGAYGIVAADLNDDRLPDLVTANIDDTTISVLLNTGTPPTPSCVGDCNGNGVVTINELILGVNIALGSAAVDDCPAFDENGNGMVGINELIAAVNNALGGCPEPIATRAPARALDFDSTTRSEVTVANSTTAATANGRVVAATAAGRQRVSARGEEAHGWCDGSRWRR